MSSQIAARIVADSINPSGGRLTTFELTLPKLLLAEVNTYRNEIARNSASSRAIPTLRFIEQVERDPFMFETWRYRAPEGGMQAGEVMTDEDAALTTEDWLSAAHAVLVFARRMERRKTSKEQVNRMLEPWMWTKTVLTATGLDNLYLQRLAAQAQGEFQQLARAMLTAQENSVPLLCVATSYDDAAGWHLPYVTEEERVLYNTYILAMFSATRCARISYLRQGEMKEPQDEIARCRSLIENKEWSPLEMPCFVQLGAAGQVFIGPFIGWKQFRKFFGGESGSSRHGTQIDHPWVARYAHVARPEEATP